MTGTVIARMDGDESIIEVIEYPSLNLTRRPDLAAIAFYAQQMGIRGVPCFIFGSKVAVNGAETPETIATAIDAALEELNGPIDPA
jgi:protein-disulfide isomerase